LRSQPHNSLKLKSINQKLSCIRFFVYQYRKTFGVQNQTSPKVFLKPIKQWNSRSQMKITNVPYIFLTKKKKQNKSNKSISRWKQKDLSNYKEGVSGKDWENNICLFLCFKNVFEKNNFLYFFLYFKLIFFLMFLDHFDTLILKIIFFKKISFKYILK